MALYLAYDVDVNVPKVGDDAVIRKGRQKVSDEQATEREAWKLALMLNDRYGDGTHWIEDEDGNKVEMPEELVNG